MNNTFKKAFLVLIASVVVLLMMYAEYFFTERYSNIGTIVTYLVFFFSVLTMLAEIGSK